MILSWCGEKAAPPPVVLCVPSKSIDAWVVRSLFPRDKLAAGDGFECYGTPETRLGVQPKRARIAKTPRDYLARGQALTDAWPAIRASFTEAVRFETDLKTAIDALPKRAIT